MMWVTTISDLRHDIGAPIYYIGTPIYVKPSSKNLDPRKQSADCETMASADSIQNIFIGLLPVQTLTTKCHL